jgi:methionine synthase I (cobalamin-dependent)
MATQSREETLRQALREGLLIGDGGMGTRLHGEGVPPGESLELLNVERPEPVRTAHLAFLGAGSQVIQTNTFQGNRVSLSRHGLAERAAELNRTGASLAREVAGERAYVAGSIGPTGMILEPYGELAEGSAREAFSEQARALAEGGADLLILETFFALEEIRLAAEAALETGLPVVAGMAFDPGGHTSFGVTPEQAAAQLEACGVALVGANCGTVSPGEMVGIIARFREACAVPLFAQPNAGRPAQTPSGVVWPETPESLADAAARFRELGATLIGGCDGTTPEHIRAMAARLRS